MQTALHILSLVEEIRRELVGGKILSTEFYKKERTAYFFVKKGKAKNALGFSYHPVGFGFFVVPAGKVRVETREKPWPIFGLDGADITGVEQVDLDRLFRLTVDKDGERQTCVFEAIGPNANIWLLGSNDGTKGTLRKRKFTEGEKYRPKPPLGMLDPFDVTGERLAVRFSEAKQGMPMTLMEKHVGGFNRTMAKETVKRANLDFTELADLTAEDFENLAKTIKDIAGRFRSTGTGYLYAIGSAYEVYPFKLSSVDDQPEKFKSLSLAVQSMTTRRQTIVKEIDEEKKILDAVGKAIKRMTRRIPKLEQDIEKAADYETYRKLGEILQINMANIKKGVGSVTLDDIYSDPPHKVKIKLDPSLSPHENAEEYFRKYRKGREGLELLERRLEITRQELSELELIAAALESSFDASRERYRAELASLLPKESTKAGETAPRLPYKEHVLSTGLKIFIGRDGSDNDRTTFEFARPYELWFHAQQCPGSHVVIKYPNKSFEPSKAEIEETAAIAAWYSKARNDTLVPVIYTERRYVRKPRKAKPGLVTVEREKSVMVKPAKPE